MAEPLHVTDLVAGASLAERLRSEAAAGGRVIVVLSAKWAPPCKALRRALDDPKAAAILAGARVVVADIDQCGKELEGLGLQTRSVPELRAWDPAAGALVPHLSGSAWGADTPENIAAALAKWLPQLPPLPQPKGSQKALAIVAVIVGLTALIAGAIWQVTSQQKADRAQANEELRQRVEKDVAESVRKAMEKKREEAQPVR